MIFLDGVGERVALPEFGVLWSTNNLFEELVLTGSVLVKLCCIIH